MRYLTAAVISLIFLDAFAGTVPIDVPYTWNVGPHGDVTVTVPLDIPPGKPQPNLSLVYHNGSPGGAAGYGWRLGGLDVIQLCPKNKRQDGGWSNITIGPDDDYSRNRLCYGSTRLILTHGDALSDGAVYEPEIRQQYRVIAHGTSGRGPAWFELDKSDGSVLTFGTHPDSYVKPVGDDILIWGLVENRDAFGNKITYGYDAVDPTVNVLRPVKISYPAGQIGITYTPDAERDEMQRGRVGVGGALWAPSDLISSIKLPSYEYRLTYSTNEATHSNYLAAIRQCGKTDCSEPLTFDYPQWSPKQPEFRAGRSVDVEGPNNGKDLQFLQFDKYGVGHPGVGVIYPNDAGQAVFRYVQAQADGSLKTMSDMVLMGDWMYDTTKSGSVYHYVLLDKNGDGIQDVIKLEGRHDGTYAVSYLSRPQKSGFDREKIDTRISRSYDDGTQYIAHDVNGDGLSDIVAISTSGQRKTMIAHYAKIDNGFPNSDDLSTLMTSPLAMSPDDKIALVDMDADTQTDFFIMHGGDTDSNTETTAVSAYNRTSKIITPDGRKSLPTNFGQLGAWPDGAPHHFTDYNHDGTIDIVIYKKPSGGGPIMGEVHLASGLMFSGQFDAPRTPRNTTMPFEAGSTDRPDSVMGQTRYTDVTGDGRGDMMQWQLDIKNPSAEDAYYNIMPSTGMGFGRAFQTQKFDPSSKMLTADLTSNGVSDLIQIVYTGGGRLQLTPYINDAPVWRPEIVSIDNGIGKTESLTWSSLAAPITADAAVAWPNTALSKVRRVITDIKTAHDGTSETYHWDYADPTYNRQDWGFAGYQHIRKTYQIAPNTDAIDELTYSVTWPSRGKLLSRRVTVDGKILRQVDSDYSKREVDDAGIMLSWPAKKITTVYTDDGDPAYKHVVTTDLNDDGKTIATGATYTGGDTLYTCTAYARDVTADHYYVGRKSAMLKTTHSCDGFDADHKWQSGDIMMSRYNPDPGIHYLSKQRDVWNDGVCNTTAYSYDGRGNRIRSDNHFADSQTVTKTSTYNAKNQIASATVGDEKTAYEYDENCNLVSRVTTPSGYTYGYTYSDLCRKATLWRGDAGHVTKKFSWGTDEHGLYRETARAVSDGKTHISRQYRYATGTQKMLAEKYGSDWAIRKGGVYRGTWAVERHAPYMLSTGPAGIESISYDHRGNVSRKKYSGHDKTVITIDKHPVKNGWKTLTTSPSPVKPGTETVTSAIITDLPARTTTTVRADKSQIVVTRDLLGHPSRQTDYRGLITDYSYGSLGKMTSITTPDGGTTLYHYNGLGKVDRKTDARDIVQKYTYSSAGRMMSHCAKKCESYHYTNGRPDAITSVDGIKKTLSYDGWDRIKSVGWSIDGATYAVGYSYNDDDSIATIAYPDNITLSYQYDADGHISSLSTGQKSVGIKSWGPHGHPRSVTLGKVLTFDRSRDAWGRVTRGMLSDGNGVLHQISYVFDDANNLADQTRDGDATHYTYDINNRLTGWGSDHQYAYDPNDNVTEIDTKKIPIDASSNRIASNHYDAAGNTTQSDHTLSWTDFGRLSGIDGQTSLRYLNNRRVSLGTKDGAHLWLSSGLEIVDGDVVVRAKLDSHDVFVDGKSDGWYIITDRLRSHVMAVDDQGKARGAWGYSPYGDNWEIK
ncbi:RHS repeat domain-containing protein [Thiolapillus sp.]|uniref:RHS repeat domain-containing protein n=1 Tax=Thiolapillus sp. TaxID=2017437 RepID=UPI003AF8D978